jgi:hypothetical protein
MSYLVGCAGLICLYLRDHKVQEGLLWGNLGNFERGLRVLLYPTGKTYDKARHTN